MADVTTTATDAVGAGILAGVVATTGVDPQVLIYTGMGATLGMGAAPPAGRFRAVCMFAAVTLLGAALGHFVEHHFYPGELAVRNLSGGVAAALAYPILGAMMANVPPFIASALDGLLRLLRLKA